MKLLQLISCTLIIAAAAAQAVVGAGPRSVIVQSWPLSATQPQPLASVSYDSITKSSSISSYTPPEVAYTVDDLVRVGLYDDSDSKWRGVVTSALTFDPKYQQKLLLHLDEAGNVWHVSISAIPMPKPAKGKIVNGKRQPPAPVPQIIVDVLLPIPAPQPILNKPIVLSPEGTVEAEKVEKTMLQKCVKYRTDSQTLLKIVQILALYRHHYPYTGFRRRWWSGKEVGQGEYVHQTITTLGRCSSLPVSWDISAALTMMESPLLPSLRNTDRAVHLTQATTKLHKSGQ